MVRKREETFRVTSRPKQRSSALAIMLMGFTSFGIVVGYFAQEHSTAADLSLLLRGFAPLIGLGMAVVISALLFAYLICTVERLLEDEDDGIVPELHPKSRWHYVAPCPHDQLAHCLSLKEHSPPAFLYS